MKLRFSVKGLMAAIVMAAVMGGLSAAELGGGAGLLTFVLALGVPLIVPPLAQAMGVPMSMPTGMALMAVQVQVWEKHIEGNLFKDNEFLLMSTDAGMYVLNGSTVHIPQAGGLATITKNGAFEASGAAATQRTDTEVDYPLDAYRTAPITIRTAEAIELSYNKRESVIGEHEAALRQRIADEMLIKWAPTDSANIVQTSGASVLSHLAGTTGDRKAFTTADLKNAQLAMNKQNVSKFDRYALVSADMYAQLLDSLSETQHRDFSAAMDPKTGIVGMLYGFKIMQRSDVVVYDDMLSGPNAYGAAVAETDKDAVLCWQKDAVERALGSIQFFEKQNDPQYYGDVYSFEVRMGGRRRRADQKGIIAIVQRII